jgi:hypothetical protein
MLSRTLTADLRNAYSRGGPKSPAGAMVSALLAKSPEFAGLWRDHEVGMELSRLPATGQYPWLQHGDEVVIEVEALGRLTHRVVPGPPLHPLRPAVAARSQA